MLKYNSYKQKKYNLSENCVTNSNWNIEASNFAKSTCNPVRKLIEQMRIEPNPDYQMIALSIGDPTVFSDIGKPDSVISAVQSCINDKKFDGYTPSYGSEPARQAVAKYYSRPDNLIYKFTDILLTNGCSQAIDLCITVLANRGDNIIIPRPGFSIYKTLSGTLGIDVKYYGLKVKKLIIILIIFWKTSLEFKINLKLFYYRRNLIGKLTWKNWKV